MGTADRPAVVARTAAPTATVAASDTPGETAPGPEAPPVARFVQAAGPAAIPDPSGPDPVVAVEAAPEPVMATPVTALTAPSTGPSPVGPPPTGPSQAGPFEGGAPGPAPVDEPRPAGCTSPQLRRFIKSRAYIPMHELRRRFAIDGPEDDVASIDVDGTRLYVGLPEREGRLLGELLRGGDVGAELSQDPVTPIIVGVYPMRPVPRS
jgi:hypothetical protein